MNRRARLVLAGLMAAGASAQNLEKYVVTGEAAKILTKTEISAETA